MTPQSIWDGLTAEQIHWIACKLEDSFVFGAWQREKRRDDWPGEYFGDGHKTADEAKAAADAVLIASGAVLVGPTNEASP